MSEKSYTYEQAGVSIAAGNALVNRGTLLAHLAGQPRASRPGAVIEGKGGVPWPG